MLSLAKWLSLAMADSELSAIFFMTVVNLVFLMFTCELNIVCGLNTAHPKIYTEGKTFSNYL